MLKVLQRSPAQIVRTFCSQYKVKHDSDLRMFSLGDGEEKAVLQYKTLTPSSIEIEHTIVPQSLQGKGLGKFLAEAALEYALDRQLKVKVSCSFVKKHLSKNSKPEFNSILLK